MIKIELLTKELNTREMGCDIVLAFEYYDETGGVWKLLYWNEDKKDFEIRDAPKRPNLDGMDDDTYDEATQKYEEEMSGFLSGLEYTGRNIFARLADVDNDRYPIRPFQPRRGLPDDVSENVRHAVTNGECGAATYYDPDFLLQADWRFFALYPEVYKSTYIRSLLDDVFMLYRKPDEKKSGLPYQHVSLDGNNYYKLRNEFGKNEVFFCESFVFWREKFVSWERKEPENLYVQIMVERDVMENSKRSIDQLLDFCRKVKRFGKTRVVLWFEW